MRKMCHLIHSSQKIMKNQQNHRTDYEESSSAESHIWRWVQIFHMDGSMENGQQLEKPSATTYQEEGV